SHGTLPPSSVFSGFLLRRSLHLNACPPVAAVHDHRFSTLQQRPAWHCTRNGVSEGVAHANFFCEASRRSKTDATVRTRGLFAVKHEVDVKKCNITLESN